MCTSLHQFKVVKRCVPCLLSDCYWQGWVKVRLSRQWKEQPRQRWGRRQRDRGARGEDGQATLCRYLPLQQALWHRHTSSKAEVKGENVKNCEEDCWGERHKGFRTWQKNLFAQFWLFPQISEQFFLLEKFLRTSLISNICLTKLATGIFHMSLIPIFSRCVKKMHFVLGLVVELSGRIIAN